MTLRWDRSTSPNVTAYRVYVGTVSLIYTETYDVPAGQTSFVYPNAVAGRRYFVAVAAQANGVWGPLSEEVSDPPGGVTNTPIGPNPNVPDDSGLTIPIFPTPPIRTRSADRIGAASVSDATVQVLAAGLGRVTALAVSPRGTGLFVEGGRTVRVYQDGGLQSEPALVFDDDVEIEDVALDPKFDLNRRVFLTTSRTRRQGGREVTIERHRLLAGALGESATVVAGLDDDRSSRTMLAVTADGRIVVAGAGTVSAFTSDGRVPGDSTTGTSRLGDGPARPSSLAWDAAAGGVWSTGADTTGAPVLERLDGAGASRLIIPFPVLPGSASTDVHTAVPGGVVVALPSADGLAVFDAAGRVARFLAADLAAHGQPVVLAAPAVPGGAWYMAFRETTPDGSTSDTLVRLAAR